MHLIRSENLSGFNSLCRGEKERLIETRHRTASFLLAVLLLTIPFHETRVFSDTAISVYRVTNIPAILLAVLFFIKARARFNLLSPTLVLGWFFSSWVLLTCFFSMDLLESSVAWVGNIFQYFVLSFVIFLCIKTMDHRQQRHFIFIANVMQIVGLILSASILLNFFFDFELDIFSSHTDSDYTASLIGGTYPTLLKVVTGMSMSMFLSSYYKQKRQMFKSYLCSLVSLSCLISLFVSGGRVAGFLGLFLIFMTILKWGHTLVRQKPRAFIGALICAAVVFFIAQTLIAPNISEISADDEYGERIGPKIERYLFLFEEVKTKTPEDSSSLGQRLTLLKEFGENFAGTPANLLFGVGFLQSPKYSKLGLDPHNAYLSFFAETGILGGLLFLALVVQIGRTIYKQYRNTPDATFYLWIAYLSMVIFFLSEATLRYSLIWQFFIPFALFFEDSSQDTNARRVCIL